MGKRKRTESKSEPEKVEPVKNDTEVLFSEDLLKIRKVSVFDSLVVTIF